MKRPVATVVAACSDLCLAAFCASRCGRRQPFARAAGSAGPNAPTHVCLDIRPKLTADSTGTDLVTTANINAKHQLQWDPELARGAISAPQGGYFHYGIERAGCPMPDPCFSGWDAQAT